MSEEWDFYFARVNDAVCSIYVDLGARAEAPQEQRPWLLWMHLQMLAPRADGLSSSTESPLLNDMGGVLDSVVSAQSGAQLVGRLTGGGRREFYFYAAEPGEFSASVANVMQEFPEYVFETGSQFQPDWDHYLNLLYPSGTNLQRMYNRRVLEELAEAGDVHEQLRPVLHFLRFPSEESRAACRDTLLAIEFTLADESQSDIEGDALPWALTVGRVDSVESHSINGVTLELVRLAAEYAASYDGWSCEATAADPV